MAAWCGAEAAHPNGDAWPVRVKNHLFRKMRAGAIDLHYRDYEEPPGNGGFLLNGGRLYLDMGHIEYASPECRQLRDIVAYDLAGDQLLQSRARVVGASRIGLLHQEQHRSPHRRHLRLPRELSDEARGAVHPRGPRHAPRLPRHAADFHRRGPGRAGESARLRFRGAGRRKSRSISSSASGPITSSTTSTSGCNSTARSSTRAMSRWPITGNIAGSICSSATRT